LEVRKLGKSDIKWFNPYGDQATHFTSCTNVKMFFCNCKNVGTTFDARLIICVSSTKEDKTQVGWAIDVGQKTQVGWVVDVGQNTQK
jgi:hypothetical protein